MADAITIIPAVSAVASTINVVIHNGVFHADDVVATALVAVWTHWQDRITVCRTRDTSVIEAVAAADSDTVDGVFGHVVVDVAEGDLDHHGCRARSGSNPAGECYPGEWHCGATLLAARMGLLDQRRFPALFEALVAVAAVDNGDAVPDGFANPFSWVHTMNPVWTESSRPDDFDIAFSTAVEMAIKIVRRLIAADDATIKATSVLEATSMDEPVVELPSGGIPDATGWLSENRPAVYAVFPGVDGTWYIQAIPPTREDWREQRKPLPAEWAGKRGVDLVAATGIPGAVFCHAGRFIAGWSTREQALQAAYAAYNKE